LTHDLWQALSYQIHLYLSSVTLADVCARRVLGPQPELFQDMVSRLPTEIPPEVTADTIAAE